jgi:hypothetical protein
MSMSMRPLALRSEKEDAARLRRATGTKMGDGLVLSILPTRPSASAAAAYGPLPLACGVGDDGFATAGSAA